MAVGMVTACQNSGQVSVEVFQNTAASGISTMRPR